MKVCNLPTLLTLVRLILSPLILPVLIVYLQPLHVFCINIFLAFIFLLLCITDFFDGYFARKYGQETLIGRALDPIADKFLTCSSLIALLAAGKIFFYWVVLLVGRELFMMGLRQVALEHNFSVHVSLLGKIKTTIQMITISFIIINPYQPLGLRAFWWNGIEQLLLMFTLFLSLYSAKQYYHSFIRLFTHRSGDQGSV